ncbi:MAG: flippase-like domain-containing protein [Vicinamibacterales bacterium]|nr:flippase-like domain-containing protein [Vicinamibacterales bacterium]
MTEQSAHKHARAASPLLIAAGALMGAVLFAYTLYTAGPAQILDGIRRIGFGFGLVLLLSGFRMAVRAKAWSLCVEENQRFRFRDAFAAFVAADAIGNVTLLGPVASESAKAILVRRWLPISTAISSVVLENIFYGISVALMVGVGTLAFLLGFRPSSGPLTVSVAVSIVAIVGVMLVWWVLSAQPRIVSRFLQHDAVRSAEDRIFAFVSARRDRLAGILTLELAFHVSAVLEIYLLLTLLVPHSARTVLLAVILETVERLITIAFKFVPLRLGIDQFGSGQMAEVVGLGSAIGITLATVRTARNLFWAIVGLLLLLKRGLSMREVVKEVERIED